jgi:arsenite/tail-anchored protein-transporting ATPase
VRVLLFTGKGGVGKTTTAAATALAAAESGLRTLVMSTDPAHSLADSFDVALGDRPTEVGPRLEGRQIDAQARLEEGWGEIREYLSRLLDWAGVDDLEAEELTVFPGLDELFALGDITEVVRDDRHDLLVVDCAPTAETLRLLSLPEVLSRYMERLFPISRRLTKVVGPVVSRLAGGVPVADDRVFSATERFYARLDGVKDILTDADTTSIRLVVNPERMVVAEARRTFTYLCLFGYPLDAVVANRLLPDDVVDPWFDRWKATQATELCHIEESFAPLPILRAALATEEIVGLDALRRFAEDLYRDREPAGILHHSRPFHIDKWGDELVLSIELPFASKGEVDVARIAEELVVTVGPYRRALTLPESLRRLEVVGAGLTDGWLRVRFGSG